MGASRRQILAGGAAAAAALAPAALWAAAGPAALGAVADQARRLDQLHSLVVAQGGETLLAEAFRGPALDRPVNVKSVSKTLVATLTGAAIDRGVLDGPDQRVAPILGARVPSGADPLVRELTLADLLTMQAGLERTSGANYGAWVSSRDWVGYALSRRMVRQPGAGMLYSTGSYHVLGVALARAARASLRQLAQRWLGAPLDIAFPAWTRDPQGDFMGGNNMAMSPLALLRFGEMMRARGRWQGRQVISEAWIDASWTARTRSPFSGAAYGYGWFLAEANGARVAFARGYGGQMLFVVPERGLTVAITSDPNRPARTHGHAGALFSLLADGIMPAV